MNGRDTAGTGSDGLESMSVLVTLGEATRWQHYVRAGKPVQLATHTRSRFLTLFVERGAIAGLRAALDAAEHDLDDLDAAERDDPVGLDDGDGS